MNRHQIPGPAPHRTSFLQEIRACGFGRPKCRPLQRKLDALFCREDANAARIGRHCMIVKLQRTRHFNSSQTRSDDSILLPITDE
jgi:hypothetical protein